MARPSQPVSRPSPPANVQRPNVGAGNRPNPPANIQRPNVGAGNRPNPPAGGAGGNRPVTLPANPGGNRPGMPSGIGGAGNRPTTLPGNVGGGNRPTTLPGTPGGGNRPTTLPGNVAGGNRPGTLPGNPGSGNRPVTLPGNVAGGNRPGILPGAPGGGIRPTPPGNIGGGNRPVTLPGEIHRPGAGGNRPTPPGSIAGGNRPGGGNVFPGQGGNRPGINGNINRPVIGGGNTNIGSGNVVNRPTNINNNLTRNQINQVNNNWFGGNNNFVDHGGWGGGGRGGYGGNWGRGPGGWGGNGYRGGGGWANPYYGNWYRGSWNNSASFWTGFGVGALTSVGARSLFNTYPAYGYTYAASSYFPTWSAPVYSSWGMDPLASTWLYSDYSNPYVVAQPVQQVYDYAQPIVATGPAPDPALSQTAEGLFNDARASFLAGDYVRALDQVDQSLRKTPNVAVVHEFRALTLFALGRYNEASEVAYAVLSVGPGWNWSTLIGLYPDVNIYTDQLRALETAVNTNPNAAPLQFLLAYHYMVEGYSEVASAKFAQVAALVPNDTLSASFARALAPKAAAPNQPPPNPVPPAQATGIPVAEPGIQAVSADDSQPPPPPPPPPESLSGNWVAKPAADLTIKLSLEKDGAFSWETNQKGQTQTIKGQAGFQDGVLVLDQGNGPPLVGKVTDQDAAKFTFKPPGVAANVAGLTFTR
jgi:tetratricopeptide (TPR) repeat protein